MPFDPDQYLAKYGYQGDAQRASMPQSGFNPDSYLAKATGQAKQPPAENPSRQAQTGLEYFGQAATGGYLPHLQAAAEPYTNKLFAALKGQKPPEEDQSYVQRRDENTKRLEDEFKEYPKTALAGMLAGSVASGAALGAGMPAATAKLGKLGQAALAGGVLGAAQNPGDTEGQMSGPQLADRAKGAGVGAAVGGVAEKVLGGLQSAPTKLSEYAQEKAFKSSGAMLKDFRQAFSRDNMNELGQFMIDNKLVKPGASFDSVAEGSNQIKQEAGKKIGAIYDRLGDAASKNPDGVLDSFAIADPKAVKADLTSAAYDPKVMPKLNAQHYRDTMDKMIDQIATGDTHDVRYLNDVIGEIDDKINWSKRVPEMADFQQGLVKVRQALRQKVNDIADRVGGNDANLSDELKQLNKTYGNATTINRIAEDRTGREAANRLLSPSDYGTGAIGALIGSQFGETPEERLKHAVMGAGLGLANKAARIYGNPLLTTGASKVGQALQPLSNVPNNPAIVGGAVGGAANQTRR